VPSNGATRGTPRCSLWATARPAEIGQNSRSPGHRGAIARIAAHDPEDRGNAIQPRGPVAPGARGERARTKALCPRPV
jgi:hypothetical protein